MENKVILEELVNIQENFGYLCAHEITESDINMVKEFQSEISKLHKSISTPQVGDLVEGAYWDGAYPYKYGIIEKINKDGSLHICYVPYTPFAYIKSNRLFLNVSGGPFGTHKLDDLEIVEQNDERLFKFFGHSGPCHNGAISFKAPVKRWRIPYIWKSHTFVTEIINKVRWDKPYSVYIDSGASLCNIATFRDWSMFENFCSKLGISLSDSCEWDTGRKYRLSHNFKEISFWKKEDIPNNVKHILGMQNGSVVDCYIQVTEKEIIIWKPNPNAKDVYKPYEYNSVEYKKYKSEFEYI